MAKTLQQYPTGQSQYRIEFDYLARPFVVVTLINSADQTQNKVLRVGADYTFLNATTLTMLASQTGFDIVQINRVTSSTPLVNFKDGSVLTAGDLTTSEIQAIHIAEEARDQTAEIAQTYSESAIQAAKDAQEVLDKILAMQAAGYSPVGTFEDGAVVTLPNQTVRLGTGTSTTFWRWDGQLPKAVPEASTPDSTGGIGVGKWVDVTDMTLRAQLAAADGYKLVGVVDNIIALRGIAPQKEGQLIKLRQHTAGTGTGGGTFRGTLNGSALVDNNGTVIKNSDNGAWVRVNAHVVNPLMFGALCRSGVSDHVALLQAAKATANKLDLLGLQYWCSDTVYFNDPAVGNRIRVTNGRLYANADIANNRPLIRMKNGQTLDHLWLDGGNQEYSKGITWEGASGEGYGGEIAFCDFRYFGNEAIGISGDYTARKFASRGFVHHCNFVGNGRKGIANSRCTIIANGVSDFTFDHLNVMDSVWGIYVRMDTNLADKARAGNNRITNSSFKGMGRNYTDWQGFKDAQGISVNRQWNLVIDNCVIRDYADNAIDNGSSRGSTITNIHAINCKDGVFIGDIDCDDYILANIYSDNCDRLLRVTMDGNIQADGTVANVLIDNCHARRSIFQGFYIGSTGANTRVTHVRISNSSYTGEVQTGIGSSPTGFEITGISNVQMIGCTTRDTGRRAVLVTKCDHLSVNDLIINNPNTRKVANEAALEFVDCVKGTVSNVKLIGNASNGLAIKGDTGRHMQYRDIMYEGFTPSTPVVLGTHLQTNVLNVG